MALSDCPHCWDTPCSCGYEYKHWDLKHLLDFRDMIDEVIAEKQSAKPKKSKKDFEEDKHYFDDNE